MNQVKEDEDAQAEKARLARLKLEERRRGMQNPYRIHLSVQLPLELEEKKKKLNDQQMAEFAQNENERQAQEAKIKQTVAATKAKVHHFHQATCLSA